MSVTDFFTQMERHRRRSSAMAGIRVVICDRLLDDPDDPMVPQMLEALRRWRDEERAEELQ